MEKQLATQAEYARIRNLNRSTVSRQVKAGRIPVVQAAGGAVLVDVAAADAARKRNSNIIAGHGGRPDRAIRRTLQIKARSATGFGPGQGAMLSAMRSAWPPLVKETMLELGASELDAAKAVTTVRELIECMACATHDEFNRAGLGDYRKVLEPVPVLDWSVDVQAWVDSLGPDGEIPEHLEHLTSAMLDAGHLASPK